MIITETLDDIMGHAVILFIFIVLILYIMYKDAKRQEMAENRYDKLINNMIDNVTRQQEIYKKEIIAEVRELSMATAKVFSGVEKVISGVKDVQLEVSKVTENVKDVSFEVDRVVTEVSKVTENVKDVSSGIKDVVSSLQIITEKLETGYMQLEKDKLKKENNVDK